MATPFLAGFSITLLGVIAQEEIARRIARRNDIDLAATGRQR
jgi:hypothetical protein